MSWLGVVALVVVAVAAWTVVLIEGWKTARALWRADDES